MALVKSHKKAEIIRKDAILSFAATKMREDDLASCRIALEQLESIRSWKDAEDRILACQKRIRELEEQAEAERAGLEYRSESEIKDAVYSEAMDLMDTKNEESVKAALEKFSSIADWKDSAEKVGLCEKKLEALKKQREQIKRENRQDIYINIFGALLRPLQIGAIILAYILLHYVAC